MLAQQIHLEQRAGRRVTILRIVQFRLKFSVAYGSIQIQQHVHRLVRLQDILNQAQTAQRAVVEQLQT